MSRVLVAAAFLLIPFSAHAQDYDYCNKKYRFGSSEWWKCMQDTSWNQKVNHRRYGVGDLAIYGGATDNKYPLVLARHGAGSPIISTAR